MRHLNFLLALMIIFGVIACSSGNNTELDEGDGIEMSQDGGDALEITEADLGVGDQMEPSAPMEEQQIVDVPAPVPAETGISTGSFDYYQVQKGDTLMLIAFKVYGDYLKWRHIASLNTDVLQGTQSISEGMRIKYERPDVPFQWQPEGDPYLIVRGDTLGKISGKVYNDQKHWKYIWDNNKPMIKDPSLIFAGFTLYYLPLRNLASQ